MLAHGGNRPWIDHDRHAKGLGDGVGSDVIMGRPDAASGKHIGETGPELVHRRDDLRLEIAYDPHLAQGDANLREIAGDMEDIFVPGAPRQDLFANDHKGGSDGGAVWLFHDQAIGLSNFEAGNHYLLSRLTCPYRTPDRAQARRLPLQNAGFRLK